MSGPVIFYAWQMDRPTETTKDLIRKAAINAIERVGIGYSVENSPRLDQDTLNVPGSPVVAESIFSKIRQSALLLADVTFCCDIRSEKGKVEKLIPNPNVMIEVGYALGTIGTSRVILVMNTHYGSASELPFDLKHRRWPTTYKLGPESLKRDDALAGLTDELIEVFRAQLAAEYDLIDVTLARLSAYAISLMKEHGAGEAFHETENKNLVLSRVDLAITLMLEANVIRCVPAPTESGYAYGWTYLGRQCCMRLGIVPPLPVQSKFAENVIPVDASAIDKLEKKSEM